MALRSGLWAVVFFAALFAGCDAISHQPSGENLVEVDPTVAPLVVDLAAAPDTLVAWGEVEVRPAIPEGEGRSVTAVGLFIDGELVDARSSVGPLRFDTRSVRDGPHALRVVVRTQRSGTGSLADRLGFEGAGGETSRVLVADNAAPQPIRVTLDPGGDLLGVRWERSDRPAFRAYSVYRVDEFGNRSFVERVTDREATSWTDSEFVAGHVGYAIDQDVGDKTARGPTTEATFPVVFESVVSEESESQGTTRLAWTQAPFPGALGAYVVVRRISRHEVEVARLTDPADTEVVDRVEHPFGAIYTYELQVLGRDGETALNVTSRSVLFDPQTSFGAFAATPDGLFARGDDALVRLDPVTLAEVARYNGPAPFAAVGGGRVAVVTSLSIYGSTPRVRLLDAQTLSQLKQQDAADVFGPGLFPTLSNNSPGSVPNEVVLAPDGRLLTDLAEQTPARTVSVGVAVVDLVAGGVEGRLTNGFANLRTASPDGRYAVVTGSDGLNSGPMLYETDGGFSQLADLPLGEHAFISEDRLAALSDGVLRVLAVPSLAEVRRFTVPAPSATGLTFDPGSGLVLTAAFIPEGRLLRGYDPATGREVFSETATDLASLHGGLLWIGSRYRRVAPPR